MLAALFRVAAVHTVRLSCRQVAVIALFPF
jgi:hypothetical protein